MASNSFGLQAGKMAKIFYINIKDADSAQGYFFNNKRKAQEKGMELYDDFSFDLNGEEFESDFGEQWIYSGIIDVKEGFLFYQEDGSMYVDAMSEEQARSAAEQFEGAGAYFPAKLKTGYGECYIGSATEHTNGLWSFEYGDIYEKKQKQTTMKHLPTFESFIGSKKLNEDTDWDACEGAQKKKFAPVCKALKCEYSDLVFFELLHNELDYYTEEEYEYAFEKDQELEFTSTKFALKQIDKEDPHLNMDGVIVSIKGTKLKYAYFDSDMDYSGTICSKKDIKALEAFFLDGKKASTKDGIVYATEMSDVYGEYCMDMGFEN